MRAWPLLIGIQADGPSPSIQDSQDYKPHRDVHVVDVDCERSLWHHQVGGGDRGMLRARLKELLNNTLSSLNASGTHYYQGLNDIASVLLLLEVTVKGCSESEAASQSSNTLSSSCLSALCQNHLHDFTRSTMEPTIEVLQLLSPLVELMDDELHCHLERIGILEDSFFALSWLITWFTHEIKSAPIAFRLFDLFLSSHPLMAIYLGAAVMSRLKVKLMGCTEMHEAHVVLSHITLDPSDGGVVGSREDLEALIAYALDLFMERPVSLLLDCLSSGSKGQLIKPLIHCVSPWASIADGSWKVPSENMWHLSKKGSRRIRQGLPLYWSRILVSRGLMLTMSTMSLGFLLMAFSSMQEG